MWKKMIAAPVLGLLFVIFVPIVGFILAVSAIGEVFYRGVIQVASKLETWAAF